MEYERKTGGESLRNQTVKVPEGVPPQQACDGGDVIGSSGKLRGSATVAEHVPPQQRPILSGSKGLKKEPPQVTARVSSKNLAPDKAATSAKSVLPKQTSIIVSGSKGLDKKVSGAHQNEAPGSSKNVALQHRHSDDKRNEPSSGPSEAEIIHELMKKEKKKNKKVLDAVKEEEEDPPRCGKPSKPKAPVVSAEEARQAQLIKDTTSRCQMYKDDDSTHSFWVTQPMERLSDIQDLTLEDGPIVSRSEVKQDPCALPSLYEWIDCDLNSDVMCSHVADLLTKQFTTDSVNNMYRDIYSKDFLRWALQPPNYYASWHFGVCVKKSKKLVAFIGGVPSRIRVRDDEVVSMAAVKLLCVHEKLRSQKLAAVMIREMIRRVQSENIWQGIFASDVIVPTPISTYTYWTRSLNVKKLLDFGVWKPGGKDMSVGTAEKLYKVASKVVTPGFRKMLPADVNAVTQLIKKYLSQFEVAEDFTSEAVQHFLLPREGVLDSYVVVNPVTSSITDFCSFYSFYYTCQGQTELVKFAYSFYNVATTTPLVQLMKDALIMAKMNKFDTFAATNLMENETFFDKLKFESTPIVNHFYLYNQRLKTGVKPSQLGLVML